MPHAMMASRSGIAMLYLLMTPSSIRAIGFEDDAPRRVDVGHQLVRVRIDVRMIAPGETVIGCTEFVSPESRHIDAKPPEEHDCFLYAHSGALQGAFPNPVADMPGKDRNPSISINR